MGAPRRRDEAAGLCGPVRASSAPRPPQARLLPRIGQQTRAGPWRFRARPRPAGQPCGLRRPHVWPLSVLRRCLLQPPGENAASSANSGPHGPARLAAERSLSRRERRGPSPAQALRPSPPCPPRAFLCLSPRPPRLLPGRSRPSGLAERGHTFWERRELGKLAGIPSASREQNAAARSPPWAAASCSRVPFCGLAKQRPGAAAGARALRGPCPGPARHLRVWRGEAARPTEEALGPCPTGRRAHGRRAPRSCCGSLSRRRVCEPVCARRVWSAPGVGSERRAARGTLAGRRSHDLIGHRRGQRQWAVVVPSSHARPCGVGRRGCPCTLGPRRPWRRVSGA